MSIATAIGGGNDKWGTPQDLFDEIRAKWFTGIVFDPCPNYDRILNGTNFFAQDLKFDGLTCEWGWGEIFINPPFSNIAPWVQKSFEVCHKRKIVMLLPARTDQKWFYDFGKYAETVFIRNRVNYVDVNSNKKSCASFASMLMLFGFPSVLPSIDFWKPKCLGKPLSIPSVSAQNELTADINRRMKGEK